jgi:hypothetical protein
MSVGLFPLPLSVPAVIYGPGFLLVSFFGIKKQADGVAHSAHFGGAIAGLLLALCFQPATVLARPVFFAVMLGIAVVLVYLLVRNPNVFLGSLFGSPHREYKANIRYQRYDEARERTEKKAELDRLLDKIASNGITSLSRTEKARLEELSQLTKRR